MAEMDKSKVIKLSVAGVVFVAALGLIVYNQMSGSTPPPPPPQPAPTEGMSDAEKKQFDQVQRERERMNKIIPSSGS